jgi:hypothetical protein
MYSRALEPVDGDSEAQKATLDHLGVKDGPIHRKDNFTHHSYVDTQLPVAAITKEGIMTQKVTGLDGVSSHPLLVGDHLRLGDSFDSSSDESDDELVPSETKRAKESSELDAGESRKGRTIEQRTVTMNHNYCTSTGLTKTLNIVIMHSGVSALELYILGGSV